MTLDDFFYIDLSCKERQSLVEWNLYKTETIGAKKMCPLYRDVRFIEIFSKIV